MNPYQVMGVIAICTMIFAGVVTFLTVQGVPLFLAFLGVYLLAIWIMMGMQRRARQLFEANMGRSFTRSYERDFDHSRSSKGEAVESEAPLSPRAT